VVISLVALTAWVTLDVVALILMPPAAARPSDDDLSAALRVKVENENDLFRISGVLGVGLGAAEDDAEAAAIVVFFESPRGAAPKMLPTELDGTKVRVILTDTIVAQ